MEVTDQVDDQVAGPELRVLNRCGRMLFHHFTGFQQRSQSGHLLTVYTVKV